MSKLSDRYCPSEFYADVEFVQSISYAHVIVRFFLKKDRDGSIGYDGDFFSGLTISCQMNREGSTEYSYAWQVYYRDGAYLDLSRVEKMAFVLQRVERGLNSIESKDGYCPTYEVYVQRVLKVLGIDQVRVSPRSYSGSYEHQYVCQVRDVSRLIDSAIVEKANGWSECAWAKERY